MVKLLKKLVLITGLISILASCATPTPRIVYKTVDVPVQYTPSAPTITRPVLYITTLTDAQKKDIGEMSKAYVITGKQLMQYACLLEKVYDQYQLLAQQNPSLTYPASSSSVPEVQALILKSATESGANFVKQIQLTPKDYNDCNKK